MPPTNKRGVAERRYGFVGADVKSVKDLTPAHIRHVYFLQTVVNPENGETLPDSIKDVLLPYCGNKYGEPPAPTNPSCTVARCKEGNPHCLNYLGQDQWEKEDAVESYCFPTGKKDHPLHQKRLNGFPVGLRNLGATCYANASLQTWFHDPAFRDCIYSCVPKSYMEVSKDALHQLQLLFTFMDNGKKSFYSPLSLVECLGLNTKTEQDAQEFGSLLMSKIDNELQLQNDPQLRAFIKNHFQGKYNYSTICKKCKTTSIQTCHFYELNLNIEDNWSLKDCLDDFLKPESLVGDDKYSCSVCESLQNATRKTKMVTIPEVLNVQLMRFKFDPETWVKEKSFDKITFPETMDIAAVMDSNESLLYDLTAVLVHSGDNLETGHYLAYVLHPESKKWFVCNDEAVLEFDSKNFDPENYVEPKKPKKPKAGKQKTAVEPTEVTDASNMFSSSNAYMLSYTKRATKKDVTSLAPPKDALEDVTKDNTVYTQEVNDYQAKEKTLTDEFEKRRSELQALYRIWHVKNDEAKSYYVPQEFLTNLLEMRTNSMNKAESSSTSSSPPSSSSSSPPIPTMPTQITCKHGKLCPKSVVRTKRISKPGFNLLINMGVVDQYPILTTDDLCAECTKDQVQDRLYAMEHKKDVDEFDRKVKLKGPKHVAVNWISKAWVADWCKVTPRCHKEHTTSREDDSPISEPYLLDVVCPHLRLAADKTKRRLLNSAALAVLERIFGPLELPESDAVECGQCHDGLQPLLDDKKDTAVRASAEKQELSEVLTRGPRVEVMVPFTKYYIVSQAFMKQWMNYVKRPATYKRPESINNDGLLCDHDLFTYDLETKVDYEDQSGFFVLLGTEWEIFCKSYEGGREIVYVKQPPSSPVKAESKPGTDEDMTPPSPRSTPTCQECRSKRILDFASANIFVRVYPPGETAIIAIDTNPTLTLTSSPSSPPTPALTSPDSPPAPAEDPAKETKTTKESTKRKTPPSQPPAYDLGSRRSKRTRPAKGPFTEYRVAVRKFDTIMDLKIKIMEKTSIVPLYQKLMMGDLELDENERTIEGLEIAPNTILNLITFDEDSEEAKQRLLQDVERSGPGGFTGTGLTGDWS